MVRKGPVGGGGWISWKSVAWTCHSLEEYSQLNSAVGAAGAQPVLSPKYHPILSGPLYPFLYVVFLPPELPL